MLNIICSIFILTSIIINIYVQIKAHKKYIKASDDALHHYFQSIDMLHCEYQTKIRQMIINNNTEIENAYRHGYSDGKQGNNYAERKAE